MTRVRILFPLLLGIAGVAVLLALGVWQVQRLAWKELVLAEINGQIARDPMALPGPSQLGDSLSLNYRPVQIEGATTGAELLVLSGKKGIGAGYRVISAFETSDGRRVMLDRGFVAEAEGGAGRPAVPLAIAGNLLWPRDTDSFTPPPDKGQSLWFSRDMASMAEALGTEPLLIVAREVTGDAQGVEAVPVSADGVPNDHFGYAMTWFSLAAVWAGMTGHLLWRIRRKTI